MAPAPPRKPTIRTKRHRRSHWAITAAVVAVFALALALLTLRPGPEPPQPQAESTTVRDASAPPAGAAEAASDVELVEDDGQTLWASPTAGGPIRLSYLPPGCDFFLHFRPADLLGSPGAGVVRALGPQGERVLRSLTAATGLEPREVRELLVGVRGGRGGALDVTLVVAPVTPLQQDGDRYAPPAPYLDLAPQEYHGSIYRQGPAWCCYVPQEAGGALCVLGTAAAVQEVIDTGGDAPPLRRELEALAARSDATRHVTLLCAPSFLFTEGRPLFAGVANPLKELAFQFVPDSVKAASLSLHWGDDCYLEARAIATDEVTAPRLASQLASRVRDWPSATQLAVLELQPHPYGRRLVAQLPAMLGVLDEYTRTGVRDGAAVLNCCLPLPAGENLIAASELTLAQLAAAPRSEPAATTATDDPRPEAIAAKLRRRVSVVFARDTLEMAAQYLSEEVGVPIVLEGNDLQLEGITRNQSFAMNAEDLPAEDVLLQILLKANPDRTAEGPTDPRQKLVYVVGRDDQNRPAILITTRASAAKRRDRLPDVFTSPGG